MAIPVVKKSRWFSIVRFFVLAISLAQIIKALWNLPAFYRSLVNLQPGTFFQDWTSTELQGAVEALSLSPALVGTFLFATSLMCLLTFWSVAALLFWRSSTSWTGLLAGYILIGTGVGFSSQVMTPVGLLPWEQAIYNAFVILLWPTFFVLLYMFPDGRFVPRWTRILFPLPYIIFILVGFSGSQNTPDALAIILLFVVLVPGVFSQIYRYHYVSNPIQRQQTKWVVFVLGMFAAFTILTSVVALLSPGLREHNSTGFIYLILVDRLLSFVLAALLPVSIGFSILRYRLWEIDVIIRRTLIYGALTLTLGFIYLSVILIVQELFQFMTGTHQSPLAIVLSTLSIAALFSSLRRRIQNDIDRRFYRRKYDAEKMLRSFSATARDEVEMEQLTEHLIKVVEESMQPEHVNLWLRAIPNSPRPAVAESFHPPSNE